MMTWRSITVCCSCFYQEVSSLLCCFVRDGYSVSNFVVVVECNRMNVTVCDWVKDDVAFE